MFSNREKLDQWVAGHRDELCCVVAAGGDGTVNDLINRLPGVPQAILPLGTENLMARYFGIRRDGRFVADMIHADLRRTVDLVEANGRRFALMAGVGADSEIVRQVDMARTGTISRSTYFLPILKSIWKYDFPAIRVEIDGQAVDGSCVQILVVNIPRYGLGLTFAKDAEECDGLLRIRLFDRGGSINMIRYLWNARRGRVERMNAVRSLTGRSIRIEADRPLPLQIDGDPFGTTPVDLTVVPGCQQFLVPSGRSSL